MFTHLHVHTVYSLLDGAANIKALVARAKELGMQSLAITDHDVLFGVIEFYKEARAQGIKPIIGCEVHTAARTMDDRDSERDKHSGHLILLAKNIEGYRNLMKIVSAGHTRGFYYKPRVDKALLREHSEGLIALSACLAGDIQSKLLNDDYEGAKAEALELAEIFGPGNFYLELQNQGLEEEYRILPMLKRLHEETGLPLVATNDVHYVLREDAGPHDILLCIQTARTVDDAERMRFPNNEFYLKSEEEMRRLFADLPEAIDNTQTIADACEVELTFGELHLPEFTAPSGLTNREYLRQLCADGLDERYKEIDQTLRDRLEYELTTIENMGYIEYFLIVWDFIRYARSQNIMVGPGRGSAAGSLVAYCLGITDIDPIRYGLIFERFLNPERVSLPDIDIDFCYNNRSRVIDYVFNKYGADRVAQIITFNTMKPKLAIRDIGRAMNLPYGQVDAIAKKVPFSLDMTIDKALRVNPELAQVYESDADVHRLIDTARALEGVPRNPGTHAAGVVISQKPLVEYVPLFVSDKGVCTQFTMGTIEELGLLKMDFLGLRNLTVIQDAIRLIEENQGVQVDFRQLDYDDPVVYDLISSGNTYGVFQLESDGMIQFMRSLKPDCFEDIVAGISLYRPGPMASIPTYIANKSRPDGVSYLHQRLEPILSVTYGCMVYQEQVMQIVRDLAGYSYGRSDLVRRAMSKKKRDVMEEEKQYFIHGKVDADGKVEIPGCIRNGIPQKAAEAIYGQMESFAEYAFNKSHAAAYAVIAYQTAYLKAHYPVEFMAALMGSVMGDSAQIAKYIRNCQEMGIEVLPPDILTSNARFTVSDGAIRFGLLAVKNVGENVVEAIVQLRQSEPPHDIFDFMNRIAIQSINKKAIESLIKAGAFDSLNPNRAQHLAVYEKLIESAQNDCRRMIDGQLSLFEMNGDAMRNCGYLSRLPEVANFTKNALTAMEKEMVGVYLSGHPLDDYAELIEQISTAGTHSLFRSEIAETVEDTPEGEFDPVIADGLADGDLVTIAGIISSQRRFTTKNNQLMAFVQLEGMFGQLEIIVFPGKFERYRELLNEEAIIGVRGRLSFKEGEGVKVLADHIFLLDEIKTLAVDENNNGARTDNLRLRLTDGMDQNMIIRQISDILKRYPGETPVRIYLPNHRRGMKTSRDLWVTPCQACVAELTELIGQENIKYGTRDGGEQT
jgi:DNA polymerase-3 subunit alpha